MFYWYLKVLLGPVMRILFRPSITGVERIPSSGPAILVSNHLSFSDSFFLPLMVPRRITFLAKSDYFTGRGLKGRLTAGFFRGVGQVPVDRSGNNAGEAALATGLRVLSEGRLFGIYAEGTRSPDGRLHKGRTGVARMALRSGAPVLPVAMIGTDKVQPIGQVVPKLGRVEIRVGPAVDLSAFTGREQDRATLREVTDVIMAALQQVSGQEYVPEYASTVKEQRAQALAARVAAARATAQHAAAVAAERAAEARARVEQARARLDAGRAGRAVGRDRQDPGPGQP